MRFGPPLTGERRETFNQSRFWGIASAVAGGLTGFTVAQFAQGALPVAAGVSAGVITFTGWVFWAELGRRWFWAFMAAVVLAHGVALATVPWPLHYRTSKADILFGLGDLLLTGLAGLLLRRLTGAGVQRRA